MRSFATSVAVVLGLELLIMALVGIVPPTMTVHWIILGIGIGLPLALVILGILIGLVLQRFGIAPPHDAADYANKKAMIKFHSKE